MTVFNEIRTGHLERFFQYATPLFDEVIIYDDGSYDGTREFCTKHASVIAYNEHNDFTSELSRKKILIEEASRRGADYIVSLDADEILLTNYNELREHCIQMRAHGFDAYRLSNINLWRSTNYKRTDALFDLVNPVKIWVNKPGQDPFPNIENKLHQQLYPHYCNNIITTNRIKLLHLGFIQKKLIIEKFIRYRRHGQRGFELSRFFDESKLQLEIVEPRQLPKNWPYTTKPEPITKDEYFFEMASVQKMVDKPKITLIALIYKDVNWLQFVYKQVIKYTDLTNVEFFFVANNPTREVKEYLRNQYISHYIYEPEDRHKGDHYIKNVYRAYNYGAARANGEFLVFINSDMAFSPGWLDSLFDAYTGNNCVSARLVEQGRLRSGLYGIEKSFGTDYGDYQEELFLNYVSQIRQARTADGGLYMPLLIKKEHFHSVNGYPEGNIDYKISNKGTKKGSNIAQLTPGDVVLIDKLSSQGVSHVTAFDSVIYHFQEGEKNSQLRPDMEILPNKQVVICNDQIGGVNGEMVLWNYLDELPNTVSLDYQKVGGNQPSKFYEYTKSNNVEPMICIQNATFMPRTFPDIYTIMFLQDDLRRMGRLSSQQEINIRHADARVTNSPLTASSYAEHEFSIIPVGIDTALFKPKDRAKVREKLDICQNQIVGIFVGALDQTKGWPEIKKIIIQRKDIQWIVVSKYKEECKINNVICYSQIDQIKLVDLLNAANFFILGSKVETQCLAAIEAALCDVPIVMRKTGIFASIPDDKLSEIGSFGDNLLAQIEIVLSNEYSPLAVIKDYVFSMEESKREWINYLCRQRQLADQVSFSPSSIPSNISRNSIRGIILYSEILYRRKILVTLIGRDTFFTVPEISVFLRRLLPMPIFKILRRIWGVIRR